LRLFAEMNRMGTTVLIATHDTHLIDELDARVLRIEKGRIYSKPAPQEAALLPRRLRNARALWIVLIIMAMLAGCALLFARGSMRLSGDWQSQLTDTLTVQIMLENSERSATSRNTRTTPALAWKCSIARQSSCPGVN